MYSLKSEIEILLMSAGKLDIYNKFTDEKCIFYIAYLEDIFGFLMF